MQHPFLPYSSQEFLDKSPFFLVSDRLDEKSNGDFRPAAYVAFDATIRTSGFLTALSPDELRLLLVVLSFVTPNAHIQPLLVQIAEALNISPVKASMRLHRLLNLKWQGHSVLSLINIEGQPAFSPSLLLYRHRLLNSERGSGNESNAPPVLRRVVGRERVIAHSRALYSRPRSDVEREIAQLNGWPEPPFEIVTQETTSPSTLQNPMPHPTLAQSASEPPETSQQNDLVRDQLLRAGLDEDQADSLLERFDLIRIRRQLSWLSYHRGIRNRAGFLIAAITEDYEAPLALRVTMPAQEPDVPEQNMPDVTTDLPRLDDSLLN